MGKKYFGFKVRLPSMFLFLPVVFFGQTSSGISRSLRGRGNEITVSQTPKGIVAIKRN